ncbi:MAG: hypothetical protein JW809_15900, partial [Pirellulales bacterium]|nr:hypothetical protein [Pirellulales bacterium]
GGPAGFAQPGHLPGGPAHLGNPNNHPGGPAHIVPPTNHPGAQAWHGPGAWRPSPRDWQKQLRAVTQSDWRQWRQQAGQVRNNLQHRYNDLFTPQWYASHPYVWQMTHPHADAWAAVTWGTLAGWLARPAYGYGGASVYQENTYYINGEEADPTGAYATAPPAASPETTTPNDQWLPLGVFALVGAGQTASDRAIQLAVARDGTIGGTYFDALSNQDLPVQGSVDRQSQRVTWTVGKNPQTVMETSLENLTKDEAPVWVHFGPDQTRNWLLVRVRPQETTPTN